MSWDETEFFKELSWCPECQSPPSSDFTHVAYCQLHMPGNVGACDHVIDPSSYLVSGEAGGEANANMCAVVHRGKETHVQDS